MFDYFFASDEQRERSRSAVIGPPAPRRRPPAMTNLNQPDQNDVQNTSSISTTGTGTADAGTANSGTANTAQLPAQGGGNPQSLPVATPEDGETTPARSTGTAARSATTSALPQQPQKPQKPQKAKETSVTSAAATDLAIPQHDPMGTRNFSPRGLMVTEDGTRQSIRNRKRKKKKEPEGAEEKGGDRVPSGGEEGEDGE